MNPAKISFQGRPFAGERHLDDHAEERHDDHSHHQFQKALENLHSLGPGIVEPDDGHADDEQNAHANHLGFDIAHHLFAQDVGGEVVANGIGAEGELRHAPHEVGHQRRDRPAPAQDGVDVLIDRPERPFAGGEGDIADGAEHHDAQNHRQRLQPHQAVAGENAQVQAPRERAAAQRDRALQPAGAGKFGVG